ncbi:hypothetical protein BBJ28_00021875 [Nothophytophthora sp. Chile5]|nr:hypothetical protein BBJ28_00021875 [Nothophytophthora sp. Chile5]
MVRHEVEEIEPRTAIVGETTAEANPLLISDITDDSKDDFAAIHILPPKRRYHSPHPDHWQRCAKFFTREQPAEVESRLKCYRQLLEAYNRADVVTWETMQQIMSRTPEDF